jgi:hypothetical protein
MEATMLKELFAAFCVSAASLAAVPITAHAAPAMKPGVATPSPMTHDVQMRGRGGGRGSFGGMGGGPRVGGMGGGPRVGGFSRGPGRSFSPGRGGPRFAGRGYGGYKGGYRGRHHGHHHHKHRRFRGYAYYGLPYVYAYSDYDGGYSCAYLRRRAIRTGSSYWWRRYEECRYGYDY